jgi:hypothetical protein
MIYFRKDFYFFLLGKTTQLFESFELFWVGFWVFYRFWAILGMLEMKQLFLFVLEIFLSFALTWWVIA